MILILKWVKVQALPLYVRKDSDNINIAKWKSNKKPYYKYLIMLLGQTRYIALCTSTNVKKTLLYVALM